MEKVIAIDYDGTITVDAPIGIDAPVREDALKYIPLLHEKGYKLVLWTARKWPFCVECVDKLKRIGLWKYFDTSYCEKGFSGKLIADFYIDDRSIPGELNWKEIYEYIVKELDNGQNPTE